MINITKKLRDEVWDTASINLNSATNSSYMTWTPAYHIPWTNLNNPIKQIVMFPYNHIVRRYIHYNLLGGYGLPI